MLIFSSAGIALAKAGEVEDSVPRKEILLLQTIADNHDGVWQLASLSYANPAVNQWRMKNGLTKVGAGLSGRSFKNVPDSREGTGRNAWSLAATTYTKYRSSTLWGAASYKNGKVRDVVWNETADMSLLYPYLLADSVGGDIKQEQYHFAGGYADHKGRWAWGATIGYTALLEYRDVDPRPRNVTGRLELSVGALFRMAGSYFAGLGANMLKYKQTNEIEFKSEMGVDKVFHLTGLGSHYNRFAGDGLSTYYDGYRFGIDMNVYPSDSRGLFAACRLSRFSYKNILSDLNKLPLARVRHNELEAEAGWLKPEGKIFGGSSVGLNVYRRHGIENIFGDAASSVYPVITSNEMYADNYVSLKAAGRCGLRFDAISHIMLHVSPEWMRRTSAYIEPYSYKVINAAGYSAMVSGTIQRGRHWMFEASVALRQLFPYSCTLSLQNNDEEMKGLEAAERGAFLLESTGNTAFSASVSITRTIGRYAIALDAAWGRRSWKSGYPCNNYDINLNFIF